MRAAPLFLFLLVPATCSVDPGRDLKTVSAPSALPKGDELEMEFNSSGCFHNQTHELTFRRSADVRVTIAEVQFQYAGTPPELVATTRVKLGELVLAKGDLDGLDKLLTFYRSGPSDGCTTVDHLLVRQRRAGKVVAAEEFTDGSCDTYDMVGVTTIDDLIRRLKGP